MTVFFNTTFEKLKESFLANFGDRSNYWLEFTVEL
jgi:hypothetical protein